VRKQSTRRFMGDSPGFEDIERLDMVNAAMAARVNVAP
jgi:hypothetical protein